MWIDIKDKLPERLSELVPVSDDVICLCEGSFIVCDGWYNFNSQGWIIGANDYGDYDESVPHHLKVVAWMPAPENSNKYD